MKVWCVCESAAHMSNQFDVVHWRKQAPVVQKVDDPIHPINLYQVYGPNVFPNIYLFIYRKWLIRIRYSNKYRGANLGIDTFVTALDINSWVLKF